MGGSKSNTGIKPLDAAADNASQFIDTTAKNAVAAKADAFKNFAYSLKTGNFNNLLETGAKTALFGKESIKALGGNPDKLETTIERAQREGDEKAAQEASDAADFNEQMRLGRSATILEGSARQRLNTPGKSATLMTRSSSATPTLLTVRGKNG